MNNFCCFPLPSNFHKKTSMILLLHGQLYQFNQYNRMLMIVAKRVQCTVSGKYLVCVFSLINRSGGNQNRRVCFINKRFVISSGWKRRHWCSWRNSCYVTPEQTDRVHTWNSSPKVITTVSTSSGWFFLFAWNVPESLITVHNSRISLLMCE